MYALTQRRVSIKTESRCVTPVRSPSHFGHSKAERFKPLIRTATPDFITPVSTLSKRTCTFGFGSRYEIKCLTGRDSPPPNTYNLPTCFDKEKPGPIMIKSKSQSKKPKDTLPGPGTYNPHSPIGKNSKKFSFRSRIPQEIRNDSPPPDSYNPCFTLVTKSNFKEITFGRGDRMKKSNNQNPGPGTYELPSIFHTDRSHLKENYRSIHKK